MIGRTSDHGKAHHADMPQGFDDYQLSLGDVMRGERATLGKSLLDVQRELRIKASYIAAIENCDPSAFDTPGFIAGYVRSYARYLGMDPEEAFEIFCAESGFSTAHGMSDKASTIRRASEGTTPKPKARDPLADPALPFAPAADTVLSRLEPSAIGSSLVLVALIAGIGYGGWSVLQEVQRVQVVPVEQTPVVLSELDPLDAAMAPSGTDAPSEPDARASVEPGLAEAAGVFSPPSSEAFDRLYRPEALDVPVLIARDAPISSLDPESVGVFAEAAPRSLPQVQDSDLADLVSPDGTVGPAPSHAGVTIVAVRPAWVEIKDEAGGILYSRVMNAGDTFDLPKDAANPEMTVGESGAVYFAVNGVAYGPAGPRGAVTTALPLTKDTLTARYSPVETDADDDLKTVLADLDLKAPAERGTVSVASIPKVLAEPVPGITVVATAESWVEVTSPSGSKLVARVMQPGETYRVPQTDQPPTIFSGNAGGIYFAVNGETYGPYGKSGQFGRNLTLSADDISTKMAVADLTTNRTLAKVVAELAVSGNTPPEE